MPAITSSNGDYFFLSDFSLAVVALDDFSSDSMVFPTVEHAYQAANTLNIHERLGILHAETDSEAERMGLGVTLRADWEQVKLDVIRNLLYQKIAHPELAGQGYLTVTLPSR